jgi:hypothetical protein
VDDPFKLFVFVMIHGGTGAAGLALLGLGFVVAKSRAGALFVATVATALIAAQVCVFWFLSDMARAQGGKELAWLVWSSAAVGMAAIAAYIYLKLERIRPGEEKAFSADFLANAVVGLVVAYVAMVAGLRVIHTLNSTRWEWLAQPQFLLTLAAGLAIAWGIAQRMRWAWWGALAAAAWKLAHLGWWIWNHPVDPLAGFFTGAGIQGLLLLAIVALLVVPSVRRACFRVQPA